MTPDMVVAIELGTNPSTAYAWEVIAPMSGILEILGMQYEQDGPKGVYGAPGTMRIYVVGAAQGSAELRLQYKRFHEKYAIDSKTFRFSSEGEYRGDFQLPPEEKIVLPDNATRGDPHSQLRTPSTGAIQAIIPMVVLV